MAVNLQKWWNDEFFHQNRMNCWWIFGWTFIRIHQFPFSYSALIRSFTRIRQSSSEFIDIHQHSSTFIKFRQKSSNSLSKMKILHKFCKICEKSSKIFERYRILLNFQIWSGAKACISCRSRKKKLQNAPTLAIVAVHIAENGPSKVHPPWWIKSSAT